MNMLIEKNVMVPMRDTVTLATDIYRPAEGGPFPVLITRLPYNKDLSQIIFHPMWDVFRLVQAGYAVVIQDTRGRFASEGEFNAFFDEDSDGVDTFAWAASQPWSTGKVGTFGGSYLGYTQWQPAALAPESLIAMAPAITMADLYDGMSYRGGAFELGLDLSWCLTVAPEELQRRVARGQASMTEMMAIMGAMGSLDELYWRTPLIEMPELQGAAPYYFDWLAHPSYDDYWSPRATKEAYEHATVPALHITGWYDYFHGGTLANYRGMRQRGGSTLARTQQHLIIGPWTHTILTGVFPGRTFGLMASVDAADVTGAQVRWFEHWLKGIENGVEQGKRVRLFVMGLDQWREEDDWPLPDTQYRPYYLHSAGRANSATGDGLLSTEAPGDEAEDRYLYDPHRPVPTVGGAALLLIDALNAGPLDQRAVETRDDVLCYTTPPLERPVEATGPVELVLFVSSSAPDTDFTGKLVDVYPDGRAEILADGILRARYRESLSTPVLMEPGRIYELHIDLWATSNHFKAGHRIRLEVTSSNFPRWDRNSNTGGTIAQESEKDFVPAVNRIHHDHSHPSHLLLPIIERD